MRTDQASLAEAPLAREIETYKRELPRLLKEGEANRFALIEGNQIQSIWDTYFDATQAGYVKFGLDRPFAVKQIDPRDPERLADLAKLAYVHVVALAQELAAYERQLPTLLDQEGRYILIKGDQVIGIWPTVEEATDAGYDRFGLEPFFVKKIERHERPAFLPGTPV